MVFYAFKRSHSHSNPFAFVHDITTLSQVANLFQNNQPIYYDPNIPPPLGGLCVHRPCNSTYVENDVMINNESNNASNQNAILTTTASNNNSNSIDQYLTFTRNILLQTPMTREEIQSINQYSPNEDLSNPNSHLYNRIHFLYKDALKNKSFGDGNIDASKANFNLIGDGNNSKQPKKRGRKRKVVDVPDAPDVPLSTNDEPNVASNLGSSDQPMAQADTLVSINVECDDDIIMPVKEQKEVISDIAECNKKNVINNKVKNDETVALGLENDEQILEYLQTRHNGFVDRAQFHILSDLCRGRGEYHSEFDLENLCSCDQCQLTRSDFSYMCVCVCVL